eukprot:TRINITY_DN17488_c0_g1_i1.p1 TRINITY_DN17488_c0_g1~~TRINITY_DN17488_c0_g1_i1.p1  ORF type:complete len:737 (+),score=238.23 TRINITY_DN17488_c0_g1_i1:46-2256(+)
MKAALRFASSQCAQPAGMAAAAPLPPQRVECYVEGGERWALHVVGVLDGGRTVLLRRKGTEPLGKTLEKLQKRLAAGAPAPPQLALCPSPGGAAMAGDVPNDAAWPRAAYLDIDAAGCPGLPRRIPVVMDPPKLDPGSIEVSSSQPYAGIPVACTWGILGDSPCGVEVAVSWECGGAVLSTEPVFTPAAATEAPLVCVLTPRHPGRGLVGDPVATPVGTVRPLADEVVRKHARWRADRRADGAFRVGTYNILADQYVTADALPYAPAAAKDARYRASVVLGDVLAMDCDLVSLQEVGVSAYRRLALVLERVGYSGWHAPKRSNTEGCAVFFKTARFRVVEKAALPLGGDPAAMPFPPEVKAAVMAHARTVETFRTVTSVCQYLLMDDLQRPGAAPFAYVNTHLYYHPKGNHIRALQLHAVCSYLASKGCAERAVLTGDLNTVRDDWAVDRLPPAAVDKFGIVAHAVSRGGAREVLYFEREVDGEVYMTTEPYDAAAPADAPSAFPAPKVATAKHGRREEWRAAAAARDAEVAARLTTLDGVTTPGNVQIPWDALHHHLDPAHDLVRCTALAFTIAEGRLVVNGKDAYKTDVGFRSILKLFRALLHGSDVDFASGFPLAIAPPMAARLLRGETIGASDRDWLYSDDPAAYPTPRLRLSLTLPVRWRDVNDDIPFSIHSPAFTDMIDWAVFTPDAFDVAGRMPRLDLEALRAAVPGLPSVVHPSDHVPMYIDLVSREP